MSRSHQDRGRRRLTATETDLDVIEQRALLVAVASERDVVVAERSLDELALLATTAGAEPVGSVLQRRDTPDVASYVGSGKMAELATRCAADDIDLVIVDDELSPAQQVNLEKACAVDVVDRVALILDIFAQHASSQEGMVQVELAQLRYRLPRLRGRGVELSRLGAGIGTRGPGETKLETDRRRILRRVSHLEGDLTRLGRTRATQRRARRRNAIPAVALVGYTNAGKSTLLNRLTGSEALVADQLFSTLDPSTRRFVAPGGETIVLSDTVGFVQKLPHQLVEAFRSTLEEVAEADLLVHVVDGSAPDAPAQIAAVREVLAEIQADEVPELVVVNKTDIADSRSVTEIVRAESACAVSAVTGTGLAELTARITSMLRARHQVLELRVPFERGDVMAALHRSGEVLLATHDDGATTVRARLAPEDLGRFAEFAVN
ncbi:MAG: GTPase HflX [Acidimicrobiia bacterium]|nr:GTPase HflX [Acidimicrobiia bacterium]